MRRLSIFLLLPLLLVSGCSNLKGAKLLAPESFGLIHIKDGLYVEKDATDEQIASLADAILKAEIAINNSYGSIESDPIVNACITEICYKAFGGVSSKAKVYGDRILLSPRGLNWHLIAHEWSHDEIRTRLGVSRWKSLPQWFDEGLAVTISQAPEHSEVHWNFLVSNNIPRPSRTELLSLTSLNLWHESVRKYGATQNIERINKGEKPVAPVYTAAGNEVRPWLSKVGTTGLLEFICKFKAGADFETLYNSPD